MAFFAKNSKYFRLVHSHQLNLRDSERALIYSHFPKISAISSLKLSHSYSTTRNNELLSSKRWHCQNNAAFLYSASTQHFMSTQSHAENFVVSSSAFENRTHPQLGGETEVTNEVLFTDSSIADSSREVIDTAASTFAADVSPIVNVVEPTLESLGLGCWYTPVGLVQQYLDMLHLSAHWPWWLCIVVATATARLLMLPIFVKTQRNAAKFANHMPQLQFLQVKFGEARRSGNAYETSKIATEIMTLMKKHDINPMKNALWPLAQAPVFISFFFALRNMARLPVESMKEGGFSWIMDLTIPDPYYIMPLVACSTLYIVLKIGAESGMRMENMKISRYFLSAMPVIMFPFCINFPSAVLFYWCTNNFLTLGLVVMLKFTGLREYFGIPKIRQPDPQFVAKKKGFITSVKESYQDQKVLSAIDERARIDEIRFKKAGTGPIPRTYSYDPTKPRPGQAITAAAAKSTQSSSSNVKS